MLLVACGPTPGNANGGGGGTAGGNGNGTMGGTRLTAPTGIDLTTGGDSTGAADSTTGPPPGLACGEPARVVEPEVPEGCEPIWLVDAVGNSIEGAHSGLVRCEHPEVHDRVVYRVAAVPCPELLGAECLCDADCPSGSSCICANEVSAWGEEPANYCATATCDSAADCDGYACRSGSGGCDGSPTVSGFRCATEVDDCHFNHECDYDQCAYDDVEELFTCFPCVFGE